MAGYPINENKQRSRGRSQGDTHRISGFAGSPEPWPGEWKMGKEKKKKKKGKNETGSVDPRKADTGGRSSPACPLDIFSILST